MPRRSEPRLFVAKTTGSVTDPDEGTPFALVAGRTILAEDDPVYRAFSDLFGPIEPTRRVEQATAAPGEQRG